MSAPADPHVEPGFRLGRRALAGIFLLGLGARLVVCLELAGSPWNDVLLGDARSYHEWGLRLAAGDWGGSDVFYQAPLYPYFLGVVYALVGPALWLVRGIQIVLGALAAVLVAAGTERLASRRVGLVAGVLAALYAPAIAYDVQIEKTSLAVFLTSVIFYLGVARPEPVPSKWTLGTGLVLGALALLRENAAILILPLALAFGRPQASRRRALAGLAAGFALVLLPVALRNQRLGGAFLPTASNAGVNFYIGNGIEADGLYRPLVAGRGHPDHEREDATRIAEQLSGRALSPAAVSGFWFGQAFQEIAEEPAHFAGLLVRKARLLCDRREVMDAVAIEVFADGSVLLGALAPPCSFGVLFPLGVAGIALARRRGGRWVFPLGAVLALALGIVAFFVAARFRLGLVPFLLPCAALALVELPRAPRDRLALAGLAAAAVVSWWPVPLPGDPRAQSRSNLSSELLRRNAPAEAERWARAARAADPGSADAAFNLGMALRLQEKNAEAESALEDARRLEPAYAADVLAELGALRALAGDRAGAEARLREALALEPDHPEAQRYLATLRREGGTEDSRRSE